MEREARQPMDDTTYERLALVPVLGRERVRELERRAAETGRTLREIAVGEGWVDAGLWNSLMRPREEPAGGDR